MDNPGNPEREKLLENICWWISYIGVMLSFTAFMMLVLAVLSLLNIFF